MASVTVAKLVKNALVELNVLDPINTAKAEDADFCLTKLNRLLNLWNADRQTIFAVEHNPYTLTANLDPHTIGASGGTFTVDSRPVEVDGIVLVLNDVTPSVSIPITMRDEAWWLGQPVPALTSTIPTDCYYEKSWPLGKFHFWPVPETAYGIIVLSRTLLSTVTLASSIDLPPGYEDAITLTLSEKSAPGFHAPISADLRRDALAARSMIFSNNQEAPRIATADSGMPSRVSRSGSYFHWLTGQVVGR